MAIKKRVKKSATNTIKVTEGKKIPYFLDHEWYRAKFEKHEIGEGKYGPWIRMIFTVLSGELENGDPAKGNTVSLFTNAECYPGSLLYHAVEVLSGDEPEVDDEIDMEAYYGTKVKVFVEDRKVKANAKDQTRRQSVTKLRIIKTK